MKQDTEIFGCKKKLATNPLAFKRFQPISVHSHAMHAEIAGTLHECMLHGVECSKGFVVFKVNTLKNQKRLLFGHNLANQCI